MEIIRALYQGDICPAERVGTAKGDYQEARDKLLKRCEAFSVRLPPDLQPDFEQLMGLTNSAFVAAEEAGFKSGFVIAGKIMIEIGQ